MTPFEEILAVRAAEAGLALTAVQIEQFAVYNRLLVAWNERMNLTALTAPEDVAVKHIIDSLTAYDAKLFAPARTLIDVGTGAGLPGIPLAVYAPKIEVTLMDALGKRVKFLTEAAAAMELRNVRCIHARAEEAARRPEHRARYDIAVSRRTSAGAARVYAAVRAHGRNAARAQGARLCRRAGGGETRGGDPRRRCDQCTPRAAPRPR